MEIQRSVILGWGVELLSEMKTEGAGIVTAGIVTADDERVLDALGS